MRTGNQKRSKKRGGKVIVNFEWDKDWDERLCQLAEVDERTKSEEIRFILKEYITRRGVGS
jgi:predicted transcriptional regulator